MTLWYLSNLNYKRSQSVTVFQIGQDFLHLVDQSSVASQGLDFLVRNDESTDSFGEIDEERRVSNVISGDGRWIRTNLLKIFFFSRSKNGKTEDGIANQESTILHKEVIETSDEKLLVDDGSGMVDKLIK